MKHGMKNLMKQQARIFSAGLVSLVLAIANTAFAQSEDEVEPQSPSSIGISVLSIGTILGSSGYTAAQLVRARQRSSVHSRSIVSGDGGRVMNSNLVSRVFDGTVAGDVVRLSYVAGTPEALGRAVEDLGVSRATWESRVNELRAGRDKLVTDVEEARRVFAGLPSGEEWYRNTAMNNAVDAQDRLNAYDRVLADAEERLHNAGTEYQAAVRNLEVTRRTGKVNQQYHVVRELVVDDAGGADVQLRSFFDRTFKGQSVAAAQKIVPHIRITRVQGANSKMVSSSVNRAKGGLVALGVGVAVLVEERTVGIVGKKLEELSRSHYAPLLRADPLLTK